MLLLSTGTLDLLAHRGTSTLLHWHRLLLLRIGLLLLSWFDVLVNSKGHWL
jgi:hypothetical protein